MPTIHEFQTPNLGLQPSETGVEATAMAARRIGVFYNQRAQALDTLGQRVGSTIRDAGDAYVRYEDQKNISQLSLASAKAENQLNQQWQSITSDPNFDPNDESVAGKFREEQLEPAFDNLRKAATTERAQRWVEDHIDRMREHFFVKTTAEMQEMAGIAATRNITQEQNIRANTAALDPTPRNVQRQIDEYEQAVKTHIPPNVTGVQAEKFKAHIQEGQTEIVHAAAAAAVRKAADPEGVAADFSKKWPEYVKPAEIGQLATAARTQQRINLAEQKQIELAQRQQDEAVANNKLNDIISKGIKFDPTTGQPSVEPGTFQATANVLLMPNAKRRDVTSVINFLQAQQRKGHGAIEDDPAVRQSLLDRMHSEDDATTKFDILDAAANDKLSSATTRKLLSLEKEVSEGGFRGPQWRDTMEAVKGTLGTDPIGREKFGQFANEFIPEYAKQRREGTLQPNALNTNDPKSMISQMMERFRRTPMQMMMDLKSHGLLGPIPVQTQSVTPSATKSNPVRVYQNGHAYDRQPDGTYKAVQ